jgi:ligand-binding sensor domain-containing protein
MNKFSFLFFFIFISTVFIYPQADTRFFLENSKVYDICPDGDYLWVATYGNGIFRYSYDKDTWANFSSKTKSVDNDFFYCVAANEHYIWAGSSEGLFTYDRRKNIWAKKKFAQGGEWGNWIRSLCYDKAHRTLWIGRFRYLTKLDVDKQTYTDIDRTQNSDPKTNNFIKLKLDGDSLLWCGTEAGLHKYRRDMDCMAPEAWDFFSTKTGGFNGEGEAVTISDILFEGNYIWFATDEFVTPEKPKFNTGGVWRFNRKNRWDRISKLNGLPANGIYCLEKTANFVWASVYQFDKKDKKEFGKGLVLINRFTGKVNPIDLNQTQVSTSTIYKMYFDGSDMWMGTNIGLYKVSIANPFATWSMKKEAPVQEKPKTVKKKRKK